MEAGVVTALGIVAGFGLVGAAVWVWRWNPSPGSGLKCFPAAHVPSYSKALAVLLAVAGVVWLTLLIRAGM